uniref:Uncharacterized protein n=1 Tax=Mammaliicoccus phage MSShimriz1 TaxID=3230127 RepID=A0AAU8GUV3_9VIRU
MLTFNKWGVMLTFIFTLSGNFLKLYLSTKNMNLR